MAITVCTLRAEGVEARWQMRSSERAKETLLTVVEVLTALQPIRSVEFAMPIHDLDVVQNYIRTHVMSLKSDPSHRSDVLMRHSLGYQLEAGEGDIRGDDDGEFTMTLLVNVGEADSGARVYCGVRCVVSIHSAVQFLAELGQVSSRLRQLT